MKEKAIISVTSVLVGNILTTFNNIGSGWTSTVTTILGFILFFAGLNQLKPFCDEAGQKGIQLLIKAAITGLVAMFIDFIPLLGILAGIIYIIAFVLQVYGLLELKKSQSIGVEGVAGTSNLITALVFVILGSILGLIPFAGDTINALVSLAALVIIIFAWMRIQQGIINRLFEQNKQN